jgi:hypothetical protein
MASRGPIERSLLDGVRAMPQKARKTNVRLQPLRDFFGNLIRKSDFFTRPFSRAEKHPKMDWALTPEGRLSRREIIYETVSGLPRDYFWPPKVHLGTQENEIPNVYWGFPYCPGCSWGTSDMLLVGSEGLEPPTSCL